MDFMHVDVWVTVINHGAGGQTFQGWVGLIVYLALYADRSDNGLESNHILRLTFAKLDEPTKNLLQSQGINVDRVEQTLRNELDRDLPLGIAQGQQVQQIRMRKFFDGDIGTLGIYVDLALHSGPGENEFLAPRGNVELAKCFRDPMKMIAFATSPGLFALLGPDAKFRRAELSPGSSEYRYPFREDMSDKSSKELGTIDSISVDPKLSFDTHNIPFEELHIKMEGTYTDSEPNFGFTAHLYFNPKRNTDGIVEWESRLDIDFGLLATLLFVIGGLLVLFVPLAPVGIGFWLMVGTIVSLVGEQIAEQIVSKQTAEKVDEESQASVLDSLPFRLPAAVRRWDPFYETQHQIVAKLDEPMVIDDLGMAFIAEHVVLDKQPVVRLDIAPYDELRENGEIVGIRYEVPDFVQVASSTKPDAKGPGVDRMEFEPSDPVSKLVTLTLEQIEERKARKRLLAPIVLDARRINMFHGQIERLLCTTWRIRTQQRDRLIQEFQERTRADIEANELPAIKQKATADLTAKLGRPPTEEELDKEVELRVQSKIEERQKDYEDGDLRDDLHPALAPLLHFDLAPEELISLQEHGAFSLEGKEIIVRENRDGSHTPYYRDHPDRDPRDNLLSLPHYLYPYVPPPPP
jgi:hypothetical protein